MSLRPGGGGRKGGRGEGRTGKYKKGLDMVEARRRREEGYVEIRKSKRGDSLSRKRRDGASSASDSAIILESESVYSGPSFCRRHGIEISLEFAHDELDKIHEMAQRLWSEDLSEQIKSASYFGKITSTEEKPPIDLVIKAGVVPRLVQFLPRQDLPAQQFEAVCTLVNISAGTPEHTQVVVDHGAVPHLIQLLSSPSEEVREQAVLTLGNIAGDSDIVLESGALIPLLSLLNPRSRLRMLRNATWTLSNLFNRKPEIDKIKPALSVLQKLVYSNDDVILGNTCWALLRLFDRRNFKVEDIFSGGNICSRLVDLITYPSLSVQIAALKMIVNVSAGDDSQTQLLIDNRVLPSLLQLLTHHDHHHKSNIRRLACKIISNITAGNKSQVQSVIDSKIISPLVFQLKQAEYDVKREAAWAVLNTTSKGTFEQIHFIANQRCIHPLCDLLVSPDAEVVSVCLEALENILKVGEAEKELGVKDGAVNIYAQEVDDCDGLAKIENLQLHPLPSISHASIRMLKRYWEEDNDNDNDNNANDDGGGDDDGRECKGDNREGDNDCDGGDNDSINALAST